MNPHERLILCLFGTYESQFPRTKTLIDSATRGGLQVRECHIPFWELRREKEAFFGLKSFIQSSIRMVSLYLRLVFKFFRMRPIDALVVGYNGYFDMPLAKLLSKTRGIPLIYTPVFPLYETLVEDRRYVNKKSLKSKVIHKVDETACRLADLIIIETQEYIHYYHSEFGIPREKFFKLPLGADEENFYPRAEPGGSPEQVKILFYGKFIPLQGIPYIIQAAKLIEHETTIRFEIIGSGQLTGEVHALAQRLEVKNITFIDWVDYGRLPHHIQGAQICLGIFGDTPKAARGIPIKVYEALAMKKPVITGDSPAAREAFVHGQNAWLCPMADAQSLAESIQQLSKDRILRERLAEEGNRLYHRVYSSERLAEELKKALDQIFIHFRDRGYG